MKILRHLLEKKYYKDEENGSKEKEGPPRIHPKPNQVAQPNNNLVNHLRSTSLRAMM